MSFDYTMEGLTHPDFNVTCALSDKVSDLDSLENLAVEQDTSAANTVKLATAGGKIFGFILVAEDGTNQGEGITVTVQTKGGYRVKTTAKLEVGTAVVGGGDGAVQAAGEGASSNVTVWESVDDTTAIVYKD